MDGWVGYVGWPIADGLTTKWSPIQLAVWCRIGKVRGWDQRYNHYATPPTISSLLDLLVFVFTTFIYPFHIIHFLYRYVICRLYPAIYQIFALFNNINVISKSEVVHLITMNTFSSVFSILDFIHYSLQEQSKWSWWQWISLSITKVWNHSLRCPLTNTANCVSL